LRPRPSAPRKRLSRRSTTGAPRFEYEKLESLEVGVALPRQRGQVDRRGNVSINEAFARLRDGELWLLNFTIPGRIREASHFNHEPNRPRKLLLHREQMQRLAGRAAEKGLTLVPWRPVLQERPRQARARAGSKARSCGTGRRDIQARDVQREIARSVAR